MAQTLVYSAVLTPAERGYVVHIPDLDLYTEGSDLSDALRMARDAIGAWGTAMQDAGNAVPPPSGQYPPHEEGELVTLVDIDLDAYRRAQDTRAIRKSVTIPSYLNDLAVKAGLSFSQVLQDGLKQRLGVR